MTNERDQLIALTVMNLATARGDAKCICQSEAAGHISLHDWRALMPEVHAGIERLASEGKIIILQKGLDVGTARPVGPYRVRARGPKKDYSQGRTTRDAR